MINKLLTIETLNTLAPSLELMFNPQYFISDIKIHGATIRLYISSIEGGGIHTEIGDIDVEFKEGEVSNVLKFLRGEI